MLNLLEVTTLLKSNGINAAASILKVKKAEIYNFLKNNCLVYTDGEVKPIINSNNEIAVTKVIQKHNNDIDVNSLKELISLIEPIKEVIQECNKHKNIIEVERVELKPPSITEVKQKLFKVDIEVLDKWNKFILDHKEYKVQSLISLALQEFIEKYK